MIGDEALNSFKDEELELDVTGLDVEDGCYIWYMSVRDKVADWFNMETGEAVVIRLSEKMDYWRIYIWREVHQVESLCLIVCRN